MRIKNNKIKGRKAVYFTIDAIFAAMLLIVGLLIITSSYINEAPRTTISHLSGDLLNVLGELKVGEVNDSFVQQLIDNGSISELNNSVLTQLGTFWANNSLGLAASFIGNITANILPVTYGFGIYINNELIFSQAVPFTNSLVSSKKIISGIQKAKPVKGFIAKAKATSIQKVSDLIIPFSPQGSGWDGSNSNRAYFYLTKYFNLSEMIINNATLYLSVHLEDSYSGWDVVNINGGTCTVARDSLDVSEGEGTFTVINVSTCFVNGTNNVTIQAWNDGYNAHIHPGTFININYNRSEQAEFLATEHSEKFYFDNVVSDENNGGGSGAWAILPFDIPAGATNISARLHVNAKDVEDIRDRYGWWWYSYRDAYDIRIYVNSDSVFYQKDEGDSTDINDGVTTSCGDTCYSSTYDWDEYFDITTELTTGTNVVSVYLNCYGDTVGGDDTTTLYSSPFTDPQGSSFVEVNYSLSPSVPYGVIEVRQTQTFGGSPSPTKDTSFSFPSQAVDISSAYALIVNQYSYITRVYAETASPPNDMVFESPSARAVPTDVYIPTTSLDISELATNYVRLQETGGNDIRGESAINYGFYIPSLVGYGSVFSSAQQANTDAAARLDDVTGIFVDVSEMIIENSTMSDVPSLWGPAIIELRVWN